MLRTRLLWFSLGFTFSAATISHFVWKDLWSDRHALFADMKRKFDALEARVSNLESLPDQNSTSEQALPSRATESSTVVVPCRDLK